MATQRKTWALLVGINFYPDLKHQLFGCIHDITDVEEFLTARLTNIEITKLIASTPVDFVINLPPEEASSWPTVANVKSTLDRIIDLAGNGDNVYIHYSGHGTQYEITMDDEYSNLSAKDSALVLYRQGTENCYLRGIELAGILEKMVEKGLIVTVVLDCCNSGSITRKGDQESVKVRGVKWDSTISKPQVLPARSDGGTRDGNPNQHWLLDPKGYTLLAACGPHEKAYEHQFKDTKRGVLTYWMMSVLAMHMKGGRDLTYRSLHNFLRSKLRVEWPLQNPMLFGRGDAAFLGLECSRQVVFANIIETLDGTYVRLDVGGAHGVCKGDEYAVYPLLPGIATESGAVKKITVCKVTCVKAITSTAEILSGCEVEVGWHAKPLTRFSINPVPIIVPSEVGGEESWGNAINDRKFLRLTSSSATGETASYIVRTNSEEEYQIFNAGNKPVVNIPTVSARADQARQKILAIVEHLAQFKFIEGLDNKHPCPEFRKSFCIDVQAGGRKYSEMAMLQVKDQDIITILFRNRGGKRLYLSIYNLKPSWTINGLFSEAGQYRAVEANETSRVGIRMSIPENLKAKGNASIEDILKVFVTASPTSFEVLAMPRVPGSGDILSSTYRGNSGRLSSFLADLQPTRRNGDPLDEENWVAQNFTVRTTLK